MPSRNTVFLAIWASFHLANLTHKINITVSDSLAQKGLQAETAKILSLVRSPSGLGQGQLRLRRKSPSVRKCCGSWLPHNSPVKGDPQRTTPKDHRAKWSSDYQLGTSIWQCLETILMVTTGTERVFLQASRGQKPKMLMNTLPHCNKGRSDLK
jgi:hypothetical protein